MPLDPGSPVFPCRKCSNARTDGRSLGPGSRTSAAAGSGNPGRPQQVQSALQWSDSLATGAQQWADYLASAGQLQHSGTPGVGENLLHVLRAALASGSGVAVYTVTQLVDIWGDEKRYFIGGIFPNVGRNGCAEGGGRVVVG